MESFLEKYTKKSVPDESTLRKKHVRRIVDATLLKIKEIVVKSHIYFVLDKTMDAVCFTYTICSFNWREVKLMLFEMYNLEKLTD